MQLTVEQIWTSAQGALRGVLNSEIYALWFQPLRAVELQGDALTLEVANDFCEVWLRDNYMGLLGDALTHASGQPLKVQFRVATARAEPPAEEVLPVVLPESPAVLDRNHSAVKEFHLNPKYTFDTFVVGETNNHSFAATMAVAQSPGKAYNPLFLYGGVGLGKTHLLHAIGQYVAAHKKGARIAYVSCEKFTNEYIEALQNTQNGQMTRFRKKYRQPDVLLIDDIQFLAGKERIQEEFFHTFNALHEAHKQIVLTCDRPATEIQNIEQRLVSRFEWGLSTDLQPPDVETRLAILRKKQKTMGADLPDEVLNFLAQRIRTNIRRLEGALIRVASYASLTGKKITLDSVEILLREILHEEGRHTVNIDVIQKRVAEHYDIRLADMTSKRRPEHIAFPRQVAMFLARHLTESSLSTIGDAFGGRDHGTVLHACRLVKNRMDVDVNIRQVIKHLEKQLTH